MGGGGEGASSGNTRIKGVESGGIWPFVQAALSSTIRLVCCVDSGGVIPSDEDKKNGRIQSCETLDFNYGESCVRAIYPMVKIVITLSGP